MGLCVLKMLNNPGNNIDSLEVRYNKTSNDVEKAEEIDKVYLSACLYRINSTCLSSSCYSKIFRTIHTLQVLVLQSLQY